MSAPTAASLGIIGISTAWLIFMTLPVTLAAIGVLSENENENFVFMWLWVIPAVFGGYLTAPAIALGGIAIIVTKRTWLTFVALLCSLVPLGTFIMMVSSTGPKF